MSQSMLQIYDVPFVPKTCTFFHVYGTLYSLAELHLLWRLLTWLNNCLFQFKFSQYFSVVQACHLPVQACLCRSNVLFDWDAFFWRLKSFYLHVIYTILHSISLQFAKNNEWNCPQNVQWVSKQGYQHEMKWTLLKKK